MYAAYIDEHGPPEAIRYGDLPDPAVGDHEVLVDVDFGTVNPVDTFVRSGAWRTPLRFPFVIGRDLVGTVAAQDRLTGGFRVGDRVWCNSLGHAGRQGAAAQRAAVPADRLYPLPVGIDPAAAVAVVHPAATAYLGLFVHGRLQAGETALIAGGAGNVGGAMIEMASRAGARVVATARPPGVAYCRSLGASDVFDYRDAELAARIRDACPGGVDVHLDTAGKNDLTTTVDLMARRGRVVVLAGMGSCPQLPAGQLYLKDCSVIGYAISQAETMELAAAARRINGLLEAGRLRARHVEIRPLREAGGAHRSLEAGELHGRRIALRTAE